MQSRARVCAALLGIFLAGPALAQDHAASDHTTALVDIDALTIETDFTVFMRKDVPEEVRRAALRRLWVLMRLPVSCDELCYGPQVAASDATQLATQLAGRRHPDSAE